MTVGVMSVVLMNVTLPVRVSTRVIWGSFRKSVTERPSKCRTLCVKGVYRRPGDALYCASKHVSCRHGSCPTRLKKQSLTTNHTKIQRYVYTLTVVLKEKDTRRVNLKISPFDSPLTSFLCKVR